MRKIWAISAFLVYFNAAVISPAIVAILFGGVIFSVVPATLTNLALVAILLLLGALGLLVAYRSGS